MKLLKAHKLPVRLHKHFFVQTFLAAEVIIDGGTVDPGLLTDFPARGLGVTALGKDPARGLKHHVPGGKTVPAGSAPFSSSVCCICVFHHADEDTDNDFKCQIQI